jgi:hypothetical protein
MNSRRGLTVLLAGAGYVLANLMGILYSPILGLALIVLAARELADGHRRSTGFLESSGGRELSSAGESSMVSDAESDLRDGARHVGCDLCDRHGRSIGV